MVGTVRGFNSGPGRRVFIFESLFDLTPTLPIVGGMTTAEGEYASDYLATLTTSS